MKKALAMILSLAMLLGVFAIGATASDAAATEVPVLTCEEIREIMADFTTLEDLLDTLSPDGWLWSANMNRIPRAMDNRFVRYLDRAAAEAARTGNILVLWDVEDVFILWAIQQAFNPSRTQLFLNISVNSMLNDMNSMARSHNAMGLLSSFVSWVGGQLWWAWLPVVVGVGVFLWEPVIAPFLAPLLG
ncbi:MAG: hypothetical protein FWB76_06195 [Oscillospiraceae bacterium]|nr:hypothetical protein [Oscillospiraceae bacterium]